MICCMLYYCISLAIVELDARVLSLPKFRPSSEVPTDCIPGFPEKNVLTVFSFSYSSSADGATDICTSVVLPRKKGMNSSTKHDSSRHKSIYMYLVQLCCICFGRWRCNSRGVVFDRPPGHSHIEAGTSNSVIHRQRQVDMTLDLGEDE